MDRRRALTVGLAAAMLVLLLSSSAVSALDTALCEQELPSNPDIQAFKACAKPGQTTADCCRKLLPFAKYYECLEDPTYKQAVNDFLGGTITVDQAQQECMGD